MRYAFSALLIAAATLLSAHGGEVRYTSVKALEETISTFLPKEERFSVTGQVTSIFHRDGQLTIALHDGGSNIVLADKSKSPSYIHGDIVAVTGMVVRNPGKGEDGITAHSIVAVGHAPLPHTTPLRWGKLLADPYVPKGCWSLRGVISSIRHDDLDVHWNWLTLRGETLSIPIAVKCEEYPLASLTNLVDAEVAVKGVFQKSPLMFAGRYFVPFGTNGIEVVYPPIDPFSAPLLGTGDIRHRQIVRGKVKAVIKNRLFLQTNETMSHKWRLMSVLLNAPRHKIHAGDIVTVSGFQSLANVNMQLVDAVVRQDGRDRGIEEKATAIEIEDLFTSPLGLRQVSKVYHGKLIRVAGTVVTTTEEAQNTGVMRLRKKNETVEVQVSEIDAGVYESVDEGCLIAATGLCIVELENDETALPVHKRTLILPRTAADIQVLSRPPWWTPPKLFAIIAVLFALLSAALAWNKVLTNRARRHGEELFREKIAHAAAEVKVEVRTKLSVELHDSISQSLTGIALQLDSAERANANGNCKGVSGFLGLARQMLGSCRRELQSCLLDLRNRTFEEKDLSEAIRRTVLPLSENAEVAVRFNVPRELLSDMTTHTILKIIRELVVNAIRHGKATRIRIAGEMDGEEIRFSVKDDGTGFDPGAAPGPGQGHFGLQGIRERIRDFCGEVSVKSSPGRGTKVTVTMKPTMER